MITVVGGVYRERCMRPRWDEVFGSAGRAASALSRLGTEVRLHGYADAISKNAMAERAKAENFSFDPQVISEGVQFHYAHGLAHPSIKRPSAKVRPLEVTGNHIVRFGMIESTAIVKGDYVVYDPQNVGRPEPFSENGSEAQHLALVLNRFEASELIGARLSVPETASRLCDTQGAEVVIIKMGAEGAFVFTRGESGVIPAYETKRVWKIGSGDTFVASFAHAWASSGMSPIAAAHFASKATAYYCERQDFASTEALAEYKPDPLQLSARFKDGWRPTVYLAGPFFTLNELWIIEEARNCLRDMGARVISPYHDIGHGPAEIVVPQDIDAIRRCDLVFAIADGLDPGTIYEIGFARAIGKPVVIYAENETSEDLKMMAGSDCFISSDFVSAIYRSAWTAAAL
jgi:nucleoside 2-deoxyribosyltransferase